MAITATRSGVVSRPDQEVQSWEKGDEFLVMLGVDDLELFFFAPSGGTVRLSELGDGDIPFEPSVPRGREERPIFNPGAMPWVAVVISLIALIVAVLK